MSPDQAKTLIQKVKLRVTPARISVLCLLSEQKGPVSYSDLTEMIQQQDQYECDPATVYRNLLKFTEVGLTRMVSQAQGKPRYELASRPDISVHQHPHFYCIECKEVSCLPGETVSYLSIPALWKDSIIQASIQLQGVCPQCA